MMKRETGITALAEWTRLAAVGRVKGDAVGEEDVDEGPGGVRGVRRGSATFPWVVPDVECGRIDHDVIRPTSYLTS